MIKKKQPIKNQRKSLNLSYIDPNLWWTRSLKVNSKEWKEIRQKILIRDNHACYFCEIRALKYMIVDHISGDAKDNKIENLRVLCPMCDTIRHSGLAGIKKNLELKISKLDQLEIVERTRIFYLKNKRCPIPKEIDKNCKNTNLAPIEVATLESEKIPKKWENYKGFFMKNFFEKNFTARFLKYLI